jgi:hypothetical protein
MAKVGRLVSLLVSLGLVGCGSSGGGGSTGPTVDKYNAALANAVCAYYVACNLVPNNAICTSSIAPTFGDATLIADVASGRVKYDAAKAQACINDQATIDCDGTSTTEAAKTNADCNAVFTGTVASGMACTSSAECSSDFCMKPSTCTASMQCCAGTCAAAPTPAADGADCSATGKCAGTDVCVGSPIDGTTTCRAPAAMGAACVGNAQCPEGSNCQFTVSGQTFVGKCGVPKDDGQTCDTNSYNECHSTSYCEGTMCTPLLAPAATCNPMANVGIGNCVYYANCINNVCVQSGEEGATCDPSLMSFDCGGLLLCDSTTMKCVQQVDMVCTSM